MATSSRGATDPEGSVQARSVMVVLPRLVVHWWALLIRGIAAIAFGLLALVWPGITLSVLVWLFGAFALVDGVFAVIAAVSRARGHRPWGILLVEGLLGLGIGIVTFVWPSITAVALLALIAAWAILTGVFEVAAAIRIRKEVTGEWILALSGALSIVFGIILVLVPRAGAVALAALIGFYAIYFGILFVVLGLRLRPKESPRRIGNPLQPE